MPLSDLQRHRHCHRVIAKAHVDFLVTFYINCVLFLYRLIVFEIGLWQVIGRNLQILQPHMHLAHAFGLCPVEFHQGCWCQKTRVSRIISASFAGWYIQRFWWNTACDGQQGRRRVFRLGRSGNLLKIVRYIAIWDKSRPALRPACPCKYDYWISVW